MSNLKCFLASAIFMLSVASASASIVENFELPGITPPSFRSGWTVDPTWQVGLETNSNPNIEPANPLGGDYFAFSGRPNATESNTGKAMSHKLTATLTTLTWLSAGFAGPEGSPPDGSNFYEILDSNQNSIANSIQNPGQSNAWVSLSIDLSSIGLFFGDEFYFRAVDNNGGSNYAWIAFDNLETAGDVLPTRPDAVPEALSIATWGLMGLTFAAGGWKSRVRR